MLGKVKTVLRRLNAMSADGVADARPGGRTSVGERNGTAEEPTADDPASASRTDLYECPSCERVYVATDKHTCSSCHTDVDRVE